MNNETYAVMCVLGGAHPGNFVQGCRLFSWTTANEDFRKFISEDIPKDWHKFRELCSLYFQTAEPVR